ncbi:hypothetical protein GCM10018793_45470 [Streptomyces sulfonofaciens]|uniref:UspA domain-containing protein n=1 Tax=Streptomyces sulfonofaciens TaxID=68272 RepID=A0A919GF06_9ACTN|nr:universal stress protein [Streptomyces sulfonofaciens]GHH83423.1 hypothetical protein GCM10018793_45470 [Streptomyces sulfonofaciens]
MRRTIAAGVDGSPQSVAAAGWAADEAANRGLELRLVHVRDTGAAGPGPVDAADPARERDRRELAELADGLGRTHPALPVETAELDGEPVAELCRAAEEAELTVLGSRGLGGIAGFVAGSVSLGVLAHIRRPVVLVGEQRSRTGARAGGETVVGWDPHGHHDEALDFAFRAAERYGGSLRVVYTWSIPGLFGPDLAGCTSLLRSDCMGEHERTMDEALASWAEKYPAVAVRGQCGQGRAAQALVEASQHARLVVVGRRNRPHGPRGRIGPVAHAVVHHAKAPVAVVPHD